MANRDLAQRIEAVYIDTDGTYGSPRICYELQAQGAACSKNRIARLMRLRGLKAKQVRRYKTTTRRNKAHRAAPNLLARGFSAERPDHKWLTDITDIPTGEGWLYLAAILDLYTRRIVGRANDGRADDPRLEDGHPPTPARHWLDPPLRSR
jgi:putative transposase